MNLRKYTPILALTFSFCLAVVAQQSGNEEFKKNPCNQAKQTTLQIIKEAEASDYRIRRIEIWGNFYTRDKDFRNEMVLSEGDLFTKKLLDETMKNFNKMGKIKNFSLKNMKMTLDSKNRDAYIIFCVKEKNK